MIPVTRELIIPVSVPQVHVVHSIEMKLPSKDHFVVGTSIPVSVFIKSHKDWAPVGDELVTPESRFMYDIIASESWAISGKKKAYFSIVDDDKPIKLTLVPLKTGKLSLPKIKIQRHESVPASIIMEVDYKNEYQSALVVPELDRLTLSF